MKKWNACLLLLWDIKVKNENSDLKLPRILPTKKRFQNYELYKII